MFCACWRVLESTGGWGMGRPASWSDFCPFGVWRAQVTQQDREGLPTSLNYSHSKESVVTSLNAPLVTCEQRHLVLDAVVKSKVKLKSFSSHLAHRAVLIFNSLALIDAPAEAAIPWIQDKCVAQCVCSFPSLCWYHINTTWWLRQCVWASCPRSHLTAKQPALNVWSPFASPLP